MSDIVERLRDYDIGMIEAADEVERILAENKKLREAVSAERERCAKIAERYLSNNEPVRLTASSIAAAIRE